MKTKIILSLLFFVSLSYSTHTVLDNADYASCSTAVAIASYGDSITIPADTSTWSSVLTITKALKIFGAGNSKTRIILNYGADDHSIKFVPANNSVSDGFRLSKIEFDCGGISHPFILSIEQYADSVDNFVIDSCRFLNTWSDGVHASITIYGSPSGVIYNNYFSGHCHIDNYGLDDCRYPSVHTKTINDSTLLTWEDNEFYLRYASGSSTHRSTMVCWRYNTWHVDTAIGIYPWFDQHGNQPSGVMAGRIAILYGNRLIHDYDDDIIFVDQRGGQMVAFYNKTETSQTVSGQSREEYCNSATCGDTIDWFRTHDCYFANNRNNLTIIPHVSVSYTLQCVLDNGPPIVRDTLRNNVDFWSFDESFDGTSGCGCGTLGDRPVSSTVGVGYFATTLSCDSVPVAAIGHDHTINLTGVLYRMTAVGWEQYFAMPTYPHYLRGSQASRSSKIISIQVR